MLESTLGLPPNLCEINKISVKLRSRRAFSLRIENYSARDCINVNSGDAEQNFSSFSNKVEHVFKTVHVSKTHIQQLMLYILFGHYCLFTSTLSYLL